MNWSEVYEGWLNKLFPPEHLKALIKETSDERMAICNVCNYHSRFHKNIRPDDHCIQCGCTLSAKTACLSCNCPFNKWNCVLSKEQEDELKSDIDEDGNE